MNADNPPDISPQATGNCLGRQERCPLCARDNGCRVAKGHLYKGACWCQQMTVPSNLLRRLMECSLDPACLCRPCLERISRLSQGQDDIEAILEEARTIVALDRVEEDVEADYYRDEFGHTVFTAAYHLKRGNCCENQCRHCPY